MSASLLSILLMVSGAAPAGGRQTPPAVRRAALEAAASGVSPALFDLELARIVALADNGHTSAFPGPRSLRYNRAPFRLVPFGEEFYVLHA